MGNCSSQKAARVRTTEKTASGLATRPPSQKTGSNDSLDPSLEVSLTEEDKKRSQTQQKRDDIKDKITGLLEARDASNRDSSNRSLGFKPDAGYITGAGNPKAVAVDTSSCLAIPALPRKMPPGPGDDIFNHPFVMGEKGLQGPRQGQWGCFLLYSNLCGGSLFQQWTTKPPPAAEAIAFAAAHHTIIAERQYTHSKIELCRRISVHPRKALDGWARYLKTCRQSGLAVAFLPTEVPSLPKVKILLHGTEDSRVRVVMPSRDPPVVLKAQRAAIVVEESTAVPWSHGAKTEAPQFDELMSVGVFVRMV